MDNATMARLLEETADLLEIDGGDSFRIRSYRRGALGGRHRPAA
jgi:DNA polymerase (family 10)